MTDAEKKSTREQRTGLDRVWDEKQETKKQQVSNLRRSLILAHPAAIAYFKYVDAFPAIPKAVFAFFLFGLVFSALSEGIACIIAWYEARSLNAVMNDRLNDQLNGVAREDVYYAVLYSSRSEGITRNLKHGLTICWSLSGVLFVIGVLFPAILLIQSLCKSMT